MYRSRRPAVILPNNTMFVPNHASLGMVTSNGVITGSNTADIARYVPFSPPYDTRVVSISVWCVAGTTENFDIGLYDEAFTLLGSLGSTGIASTTGIKTWTPVTPIPVYANKEYFAAHAVSSSTPTWVVLGTSSWAGLRGISIQGTAMPLPATGVPTQAAGIGTAVQFFKIVFSG